MDRRDLRANRRTDGSKDGLVPSCKDAGKRVKKRDKNKEEESGERKTNEIMRGEETGNQRGWISLGRKVDVQMTNSSLVIKSLMISSRKNMSYFIVETRRKQHRPPTRDT